MGAELTDARSLFLGGDYDAALHACTRAIDGNESSEAWWLLKMRIELTTGRYADALESYETAGERYDSSIRVKLVGREVLLANDRASDAAATLDQIREIATDWPMRYSDPANRVVLGRALILMGADARQVLELFYDRAKKDAPDLVDAYLASGELALEKHDYAVAADAYTAAARLADDDPEVHLGLARAFQDDLERATAALARAVELNPRHVPSLLFQADNLIDREDYDSARELIDQALAVNPQEPRAWAYRAVMAHIAGDRGTEESSRQQALASWTTNPAVDSLIGEKLSGKYRFSEGAAYQRKALAIDPSYRPARIQLAQDLLRLGQNDEGWWLASGVADEDKYNVVAFNLVTLRDRIEKFTTMSNRHFQVRMEAREAEVYGPRVQRLLNRARETLTDKYGVALTEPVIVEIFPEQKDFAIRTFGLPGGAGFLGVCFGNVVTMKSPASRRGMAANWEAVLWHEFTHVITLHKTRNKMPRWLSEGISVYEERLQDPSWGQAMTPAYRELILDDAATPVSKLSGAFLKPPTPMHLQFAYYQSSMVVQYIVDRFGMAPLQKVLVDLGKDVPINDALARHTEPIEELDAGFAAWFKQQAEKLGPGVDFEQPELSLDADSLAMQKWNDEHPRSFFGLLGQGRALIAEGRFEDAIAPLTLAASLYPGYSEPGGPFVLLAQAHRELGQRDLERQMLEKYVALNAEAVDARLRLAELAIDAEDWKEAQIHADAALAVNPFVAGPYRPLAQAADALGDRATAIEVQRTLLLLDPLDRAEHHHRLATLLLADQQIPQAKREVLKALEEAPRYRQAHKLLLELATIDSKVERPSTTQGAAK